MPTLSLIVSGSADDARNLTPNGTFSATAATQHLGNFTGSIYYNGWRFNGVAIPQGAVITSAKLTLYVSNVNGGTTAQVSFWGEAIDTSTQFVNTTAGKPEGRVHTAAQVNQTFTTANWTTVGYQTTSSEIPELASIVQEIVNRSGWVSGNSLSIVATDNGSTSPGYVGYATYDNATTKAAKLDITYSTAAATVAPDPPTGLTAVAENEYRTVLNWTDNGTAAPNNETSYRIERKTGAGGTYAEIGSVGTDVTYYIDLTTSANTTYYYRVKARNSFGDSAYCTEVAATTGAVNSSWSSEIEAWFFPTAAHSPVAEYTDGRTNRVLKPEYLHVDNTGAVIVRDTAFGTYGYSTANASSVKSYSNKQYITVSCGVYADFQTLVNNSTNRANAVTTITNFITSNNFTGADIDFELFSSWGATELANFNLFLAALKTNLNAAGKKLAVNAPAIRNSTYQASYSNFSYEAIIANVDYMCVMAYDYHFDNGAGQPISPNAYVSDIIDWAFGKIGWANRDKLVIGIPSYSYRGATGGFAITEETYQETLTHTGFGTATRDPNSYEMIWANAGTSYVYQDSAGLDSKRKLIEDKGVKHVSVWHLGGNNWFTTTRAEPSLGAAATPITGNPIGLFGYTYTFSSSTNLTKTQAAIAQIATVFTLNQSSISRIQKSFIKTQPATVRIIKSLSGNQLSNARIANSYTLNQLSNGRIQKSFTATRTAISRISKAATSTQSGNARIAKSFTATRTATANIVVLTAHSSTQSANARVVAAIVSTRTAIARISKAFTSPQAANARVAKSFTATRPATANIVILAPRSSTQAANARIATTVLSTRTALARIQKSFTKTQSSTARISNTFSGSQTANARIGAVILSNRTAVARVLKSLTKPQPSLARISKAFTSPQTATTRIAKSFTKTQPATVRIQKSFTLSQNAISRIAKSFTKTQPSIARLAKQLSLTQAAVARIQVAGRIGTQAGNARITASRTTTQPATARIQKILNSTNIKGNIGLVQTAKNGTGSAYVTSLTVDLASPVAAGNTVMVWSTAATSTANPVTSVTDTLGNVFTKVFSIGEANNSTLDFWYAANVIAGTDSITVNFGAIQHTNIIVREYAGLSANPLDVFVTNVQPPDVGSPTSGPTASTSSDNELVIGATAYYVQDVLSVGSGFGNFTFEATANSIAGVGIEDKVVTAPGPQSSSFNINITSEYAAATITFLGSVSGHTAVARVSASRTATQSGTANIAVTTPHSLATSAVARITNVVLATRTANARIQKSFTKTQTGTARIVKSFTATRPALARLAKTFTSPQVANARITKIVSRNQTATARLANSSVNLSRVNLITDPNMVNGAFMQQGSSGNVTSLTFASVSSTVSLFGNTSFQGSANNVGQYYANSLPATTIVTGVTYTFSAYVYIPLGSTITSIVIAIRDFNTYSALGPGTRATLTPGQWTRISTTSIGGQNGYNSVRLTIADPNGMVDATPQLFYVDGAVFEASSNLEPYFDGSTPGASWTGTPNNSTSILPRGVILATARILKTLTKTQSATARISKSFTATRPAIARIQKSYTTTQPATTRVISTVTKNQPATANIVNGVGYFVTQIATARIISNVSRTQTAKARIANGATRNQTATARLAHFFQGVTYRDDFSGYNSNYVKLDSLDNSTGWVKSFDTSSVVSQSTRFKEGTAAVQLNFTSSANRSGMTKTITSTDLSAMNKLAFWAYVVSNAHATRFQIRIGTNSSNYFEYRSTSVDSGWNYIENTLSTPAATVGTPSLSAITFLQFDYLYTAGETNTSWLVDDLWSYVDTNFTNLAWRQVNNNYIYGVQEIQQNGSTYELLSNHTSRSGPDNHGRSLFTTASATSFSAHYGLRIINIDGSGWGHRFLFDFQDGVNFSAVYASTSFNKLGIEQWVGNVRNYNEIPFTPTIGAKYDVDVSVAGNTVNVYVGNVLQLTYTLATGRTIGGYGFESYGGSNLGDNAVTAISKFSVLENGTQSAIARISRTLSNAQPATARITKAIAQTQPATARIAKSFTANQVAIGRIAKVGINAITTANARIAKSLTKPQPSVARIINSVTKTQTSTARILKLSATTQSAIARVVKTLALAQAANARISKVFVNTRPATARIQKSFTKTQPIVARIAIAGIKSAIAVARIQKNFANTQPAIARIAKTLQNIQPATGRISGGVIKTQSANARIQVTTSGSSKTNLIVNPGYENATITSDISSYWNAYITLDTSLFLSGGQSLRVSSADINQVYGSIQMSRTLLAAGTTLNTTSISVYAPAGVSIVVGNRINDSTGTFAAEETVSQTIIGNNGWQLVTLPSWTYNSDPAGFYAGIQVRQIGAAPGVSFWLDQAIISTASTPYFDGSTAGAQWTGTPNNSTSVISNGAQLAVARIQKSFTNTQAATARIVRTVTKTQPASAFIFNANANSRTAIARIQKALLRTQPASAYIVIARPATQTAIARVAKSFTSNKLAIARIAKSFTATKLATARIAKPLTAATSGTARIQINSTKLQAGIARISKSFTATRPATARVAHAYSLTQSATVRIAIASNKTQPATARIAVQFPIVATAPGNLLANPSYESAIDTNQTVSYWNGILALSSTQVHSGTQSLRITTGAVNLDGVIHMAPITVALPANTVVPSTSIWLWIPAGVNINVGNRINIAATNTYVSEASINLTVTGNNAWQKVTLGPWTYSGGAFRPGIQAHVTTVAAGVVFYADDVFLQSPGTQLAIARIRNSYASTQLSTSRIVNTVSNIQTANGRIVEIVQSSRPAVARISKSFSLLQSSTARIVKSLTTIQPSTARIQKSFTRVQTSTARIQSAIIKTQTASSRVAKGLTKTQAAITRIAKALTGTRTAIARIQKNLTKPQTSTARIQKTLTSSQTAKGRLSKALQVTRPATARIAHPYTSTQPAKARIRQSVINTTHASASIVKIVTNSQPAKAHILAVVQKTQTANARIQKNGIVHQTANAHIVANIITYVQITLQNATDLNVVLREIQELDIVLEEQTAQDIVLRSGSHTLYLQNDEISIGLE